MSTFVDCSLSMFLSIDYITVFVDQSPIIQYLPFPAIISHSVMINT